MSGGTGDADMYVRFNQAPTSTTYDCRPFRSGNNETCTFAAPAHGTWYVMLNGYTSYSNVSLSVTWKGGYRRLESGVEISGLSGAPGSSQVFTIDVADLQGNDGSFGGHNISVQFRGTGNGDIYVQRAAVPSFFSYDCRGVKPHSTENCNLEWVDAGKYYIEVYGAKGGFTNGSLLVTAD
jgi:vibriolysin